MIFFITLSQLRSLSLNNNNFVHIQIGCFDGLYSLEFLNISGNRISEFEYGTFLGLKKLVTLDISNNTLSYLYESTYHLLENLESLYLDHNFIASFDPYDITNHLRALKRISLNDNPWNCKSLLHIFSTLRSKSVTVFEGRAKKTVNINGIPCTNQNIQILDSTTSQSISNNDNKQVDDLQTFKTLLNVIDSQFEEFLTNFSYAPFKELRFLNNFQKTFANLLNGNKTNISNNANFRRLNGTIAKLVSELQSLPDKLANYSVRERNQLREDMFRYFNSELVNSTIGKYFSSALSHLNSLQQFLNADFKNSSFYKLFQNNKLSNSDPKYSKDDLTVFEKFVNHDDRVVTKISGLQNSLNALLVVIIIVLFCLLALFVIKMFNKPLLKFTKRNVINTPIDSNVNVGDNLN
ncbi:hypothetical protein RI129_001760 [Pyrocoelia pectoralis]|uniref:Uncharacterized protein n=1 Tax=Pyrocoelia pectoralis TaxID=417401 RepID=A0AAN7VVL7_9COLE